MSYDMTTVASLTALSSPSRTAHTWPPPAIMTNGSPTRPAPSERTVPGAPVRPPPASRASVIDLASLPDVGNALNTPSPPPVDVGSLIAENKMLKKRVEMTNRNLMGVTAGRDAALINIGKMRREIEDLEFDLEQAKEDLGNTERMYADAERRITELMEEAFDAKELAKRAEKAAKRAAADAKEDVTIWTAHATDLHKKYLQAQMDADNAEAEVQSLNGIVDALMTENAGKDVRISELQYELSMTRAAASPAAATAAATAGTKRRRGAMAHGDGASTRASAIYDVTDSE